MPPHVYGLLVHGLLVFLDIVINHELLAKLPHRGDAAHEEALHAIRETIFACLFAALGIAGLLLAEVIVSTRDVIVEGDTRVLPVSERVLHVLIFISLGVLITLVGYALVRWHGGETVLVRVDYGWASWVLTLMSVLSLVWAVRDGVAAGRREKIVTAAEGQ